MEAQLKELLDFLHDKNPNVRQVALSNLLGHTAKESPHRKIFFGTGLGESAAIRDLKLLCRDQPAIAHDAFVALVNLADDPRANSLFEEAFLKFVVSYIINPTSKLADLAAMLLSNITKTPTAASRLTKVRIPVYSSPRIYPPLSRSATSSWPEDLPNDPPKEVISLPLLVDAFVQGASTKAPGASEPAVQQTPNAREGSLHFLASVFANITNIPEGRSFFMTPLGNPLEYPLSKVTCFTEHPDTIRRGGIASTVKNCTFDVKSHKAILSSEDESISATPGGPQAPGIDALQYILLPLAGPEELNMDEQDKLPLSLQFLPDTKVRERDHVLRLTHVEALLLLCTSRWGRDFLRTHGVYEIVRVCHETEADEQVSEHIERLVNLLKRDEAPTIEEDEELEITSAPEHRQTEESDDEDMQITEI